MKVFCTGDYKTPFQFFRTFMKHANVIVIVLYQALQKFCKKRKCNAPLLRYKQFCGLFSS